MEKEELVKEMGALVKKSRLLFIGMVACISFIGGVVSSVVLYYYEFIVQQNLVVFLGIIVGSLMSVAGVWFIEILIVHFIFSFSVLKYFRVYCEYIKIQQEQRFLLFSPSGYCKLLSGFREELQGNIMLERIWDGLVRSYRKSQRKKNRPNNQARLDRIRKVFKSVFYNFQEGTVNLLDVKRFDYKTIANAYNVTFYLKHLAISDLLHVFPELWIDADIYDVLQSREEYHIGGVREIVSIAMNYKEDCCILATRTVIHEMMKSHDAEALVCYLVRCRWKESSSRELSDTAIVRKEVFDWLTASIPTKETFKYWPSNFLEYEVVRLKEILPEKDVLRILNR